MSKIAITEIHSFFDDQLACPVNIWCEDPETQKEKVGGIFGIEKSYLTYRILMKQIGRDIIAVRHRYSEFEAMRNTLNERYSPLGIMVPALPPKNQVTSMMNSGKSDGIFVKERTLGLSLFCEAVVANPFLRNDNLWKDFMRGTSSAVDFSTNQGEDMLFAAFSFMDLHKDIRDRMDQKVNDLREEISCIEKHAKIALERARVLQNAERNVQQASEAFHCSMQSWTDVESSVIKSMNGKLAYKEMNLVPDKMQCPNTLRKLTSFYIGKHVACDDTPDYESVFLIATLEHEVSRMEAMKELFKCYETYKSDIESITLKLMKAEFSKSKSSIDTIPLLRSELIDKNNCLMAFFKGLIFFTVPMCGRLRTANFRRASSYMVSSFISLATGINNACFKFLSDLKLSVQDSNNDASAVLSLLSMKPFANFPTDFPVVEDPLPAPDAPFANLFSFALGMKAVAPIVAQTNSTIQSDDKVNGNSRDAAGGSSSANKKAEEEEEEEEEDDEPLVRPASANVSTVPQESQKSYESTEKSNSLLNDLMGISSSKKEGLWD